MSVSIDPVPSDGDAGSEGPRRPKARWRRTRRWLVVVGGVAVFAAATTAVGFPVSGPWRRYPAGDLTALAEKINSTCYGHWGVASVNWITGRVDHPSGVPETLTPEEAAMLGSGQPWNACGGAWVGSAIN